MNRGELISRVRQRTAAERNKLSHRSAGNLGFTLRKNLLCLLYPWRMFNSALWKCVGEIGIAIVLCLLIHLLLAFAIHLEGFSLLVIESLFCLLASLHLRHHKRYLDGIDIPLLAHFSTLPWSDRKLVWHFLVGRFFKSIPWLFCFLLGGVFLRQRSFDGGQLTIATTMSVSFASWLSVYVWAVFLSTIDKTNSQRLWSLRSAFSIIGIVMLVLFANGNIDVNVLAGIVFLMVPVTWPYGILMLSLNGASFLQVAIAMLVTALTWWYLMYVSLVRLNNRLPVIEFHSIGVDHCYAIPTAEKSSFLALQKSYELMDVDESVPSWGSVWGNELSSDVPHANESNWNDQEWQEYLQEAESTNDEATVVSPRLVDRFRYCESYWSKQGWLQPIARRLLNQREMQVVAVVDTLRGCDEIRLRWRHLVWFLAIWILALLCSTFVSPWRGSGKYVQGLYFFGLIPICLFLMRVLNLSNFSTIRMLPYSANEIFWGVVKKAWIESALVWPLATAILCVGCSFAGHSSESVVRAILILSVVVFSLPLYVVSFAFHDGTRQDFFRGSSIFLTVCFFALVGVVALAVLVMAMGGTVLAGLGALLCMAGAYGMSFLLIGMYLRGPIDLL